MMSCRLPAVAALTVAASARVGSGTRSGDRRTGLRVGEVVARAGVTDEGVARRAVRGHRNLTGCGADGDAALGHVLGRVTAGIGLGVGEARLHVRGDVTSVRLRLRVLT